jgi:hypothetical protein
VSAEGIAIVIAALVPLVAAVGAAARAGRGGMGPPGAPCVVDVQADELEGPVPGRLEGRPEATGDLSNAEPQPR